MVASDDELLDLTEIIRRTLRARTGDHHLVEDLTQETILKVASARTRLTDDSLRAYAIVTSRNALSSHYRHQATVKRHAHRLVEYRGLDGPEHLTLEREETDALAIALDKLDDRDRTLLIQHEANDVPLDVLAEQYKTTTGSIGMRLARARANLRVEFVLAFRRIDNVPVACRNNLVALSAGDRRRQQELGSAEHLLRCPICASVSKPIVQRRRGIAAWLILPAAEAARRYAASLRRSHVTQALTAAAAITATAVAYVGFRHEKAPPAQAAPAPATAPATTLLVAPANIVVSPPTTQPPPPQTDPCVPAANASVIDATVDTCPVQIAAGTVLEVPADEGFWLAAPDGQPVWIHLDGANESPQQVTVGDIVALSGTVRANTPNLDNTGASPDQADQLRIRGAHIEVAYTDLTVTG